MEASSHRVRPEIEAGVNTAGGADALMFDSSVSLIKSANDIPKQA
jgi:hypothetical protein